MFSDRLAKVVVFLGTTAALLAVNQTALATQGTGKVTVYHLNPAVTGRGACIQTQPALQGTWACVYSDNNPLYDEMNKMFSDAFFFGRTCFFDYATSDYRINYAQCE